MEKGYASSDAIKMTAGQAARVRPADAPDTALDRARSLRARLQTVVDGLSTTNRSLRVMPEEGESLKQAAAQSRECLFEVLDDCSRLVDRAAAVADELGRNLGS